MLQIIRTIDELAAIAGEWEALCARVPGATVFQLPQWLLPWWRHLGGGEIFTPVLRRQNRLVAIAPMFLHGMPGQQIRQISFLGTGISDYLDFIAEAEVVEEFPRQVWQLLEAHQAEWDVCNLEELRSGASALRLAESAPLSCCPVLQLPSSKHDFYALLEATHRRNIRNALKKFAAAGTVRYEAAGMDRFEDFVRLHASSWQDRGETGVVQTDALQSFYRDSSEALAQIGCLKIHTLVINDQAVALILAYHYKERGYAYLGGFDPACKKLSPGTAIMALAIERAIEEKLVEWDLMRGAESYKLLWGALPRENRFIRLEVSSCFSDASDSSYL